MSCARLIESAPVLAGKIDRLGHYNDGSGRVAITPYTYYRAEADLMVFDTCAVDNRIPLDDYYACFSIDWTGAPGLVAYNRMASSSVPAANERE